MMAAILIFLVFSFYKFASSQEKTFTTQKPHFVAPSKSNEKINEYVPFVKPNLFGGPSEYVNTLIGTGGDGFGVGGDPPGPQRPFGMMRLSPDTSQEFEAFEWRHYGGYYIEDSYIRYFSHTHMVGPGASDYGNIGVMAVRDINDLVLFDYGFKSLFSHSNETLHPGYYAAFLQTHNVYAELTACGTLTGAHRYTFEGTGKHIIMINPSYSLVSGGVKNASIVFSGNTVSGWGDMFGSLTGRGGGVMIYFYAQFSQTPRDFGVFREESTLPGVLNATGYGVGGWAEFDPFGPSQIEMYVALSLISVAQAKLNFEEQMPSPDFDACHNAAVAEWDETLSVVMVNDTQGGNVPSDRLVAFYTALYHSFMAPTNFLEAGGVYLGFDGLTHTVPSDSSGYYSDMSIWDIHRTQTPLLTFLFPDRTQDIIRSLVLMFVQGGDLPRWPIANHYTNCMGLGIHSNQMILDAYVKNVTNFDVKTAYQGMYLQATDPNRPHVSRGDLLDYINYGYVPKDKSDLAPSKTLEYAFDDWAVGTLAALLGYQNDSEVFLQRAQNYRNTWDAETQYMCLRNSTGDFFCHLDPASQGWIFGYGDTGFCEGDQAEWRWVVPHDVDGLVSLFSSPEEYISQLDTFFARSESDKGTFMPNPYYWAGNEPDILEPFQFNFAGRADLTQKYSRYVGATYYTNTPNGIPGNDDFGALSAWFVWSSLGLYPLPGNTTYIVGSPLFPQATLTLQNGATLNIVAYNSSVENVYVSQASLNGVAVDMFAHAFVDHAQLTKGGLFEFWMNSTPLTQNHV